MHGRFVFYKWRACTPCRRMQIAQNPSPANGSDFWFFILPEPVPLAPLGAKKEEEVNPPPLAIIPKLLLMLLFIGCITFTFIAC